MNGKRIIVTHAQVPFMNGGAELHVKNLVLQLKKRGYDTELVQLPYKWYPADNFYDNLLMWRLLDLEEINGRKIDLVIGTKFPSYGAVHPNKVAWVTHQFRQVYDLYDTPYGMSQDKQGGQVRRITENFDSVTLNECKKVFTISETVTNRLSQYNHIKSVPLYHPPSLEGRYYCDEFDGYILSAGRLDRLKRNDLLVSALQYCNKNVKIKIAGIGDQQKELEKLADKMKVRDRVEFLGFVPDDVLLDLYAHARMIFFAPVDEDYGYITLEAFLSGKPVLTCRDAGGVLEFAEDGVNGYICEAEPELLGEKINILWDDKEKCKKMGKEGFQKVKDISWDHVIDALTMTL